MEISVHAKLHYDGKEFWMVSTAPVTQIIRPDHHRYLVVPVKPYVGDNHSHVRALDVPNYGYAVEFCEETHLNVYDPENDMVYGDPPEPEVLGLIVENRILSEEELDEIYDSA